MQVDDLVGRARSVVAAGVGGDLAAHGLERLSGGMSHAVFAPIDEPTLVLKVFTPVVREEPEREWEAMVALAGSGIAPEPIHFDAGDGSAVVVMSRVVGRSLSAGELGAEHASSLGDSHRRVHRADPPSRRPVGHSWVRASCASLLDESQAPTQRDGASDVVARAWRAARDWVSGVEVERILESDRLCFSRGDPNLSNYLWRDDGVALVDWENSGYSDPVLELADMAEHASTRTLSEHFWTGLADATGLTKADHSRLSSVRRIMACFWLVLIVSRRREGLPTTVTADEQAHRTLGVLGL